MIQEATLIEAILGFRAQIDFLWQFFVTVHIAIFALLFIYDEAVESLNIIARIFAIAGVALFEWINGKALANTYLLLDATFDQYRDALRAGRSLPAGLFPALREHELRRSSRDRPGDPQHGLRGHYIGVPVAGICADPQEGPGGRGRLSCSGCRTTDLDLGKPPAPGYWG